MSQPCPEVTRQPRGAGSCPAEPAAGTAAKPCPQAAASGKGHGSGQGAKAELLSVPAPPHTAPPPGGDNCPVQRHQGQGCHLWGHRHSPQGARAGVQSSSKTQQRAALACRQSVAPAKNPVCSPQPWHWGPWASRLLPCCLSFPSWQGWWGMGKGWAVLGGPQPRVVAPWDTQSCGDSLGKGPPAWGWDNNGSIGHLAWWQDPSSAPHTWWAQKNTEKDQSSHPDGTWGCMGTAIPTCKDEECWGVHSVPSLLPGLMPWSPSATPMSLPTTAAGTVPCCHIPPLGHGLPKPLHPLGDKESLVQQSARNARQQDTCRASCLPSP